MKNISLIFSVLLCSAHLTQAQDYEALKDAFEGKPFHYKLNQKATFNRSRLETPKPKSVLGTPQDAKKAGFKISCSLDGKHGDDIDRLDHVRELRLLKEAVEDTYPHLPAHIQKVANQITFMVTHKEGMTKTFMGWSAEDDPDYQYPDQDFYPQGTIKANFTEKFMRILDLLDETKTENPQIEERAKSFARHTIAHELLHAWQYHTGPVPDFNRVKNSCPGGLADKKVLEGTKKKIQYERDAFLFHRQYVGGVSEMAELAGIVEQYAAMKPELFGAKGPYRLLAINAPNSAVKRYMREEPENAAKGGEAFSATAKIIYEGQYAPAEIVLKLKAFNDSIDSIEQKIDKDGAQAILKAADPKQIEELQKDWKQYMEAGPRTEILRKTFPYIADVEKRYQKEMERYQKLSEKK